MSQSQLNTQPSLFGEEKITSVAIVGSRPPKPDAPALEHLAFAQRMRELDTFVDSLPLHVKIISGGARGADERGETRARRRGMSVESWRPTKIDGTWRVVVHEWDRNGNHAQIIQPERFLTFPAAAFWRNGKIVERSQKVKAVWDGFSRGTRHTIGIAKRADKLLN